MTIRLNIANPTSFSAHRAGWGYAMNFLMKYHDHRGILLDDFIDITFGYNYQQNKSNKTIPYKQPWIGFLHHPPSICPWYEDDYKRSIDINVFLNSEEFKISAKYCECLIVLSEYLKSYLINNFKHLTHVPILVMKHPTDTQIYKWDFKKCKALYNISGLKIVSIGYFLRNLSSLFLLKSTKNLEKILLPSHLNLALDNLTREISFKQLDGVIDHQDVKIIDWQNNDFYDKILEQCIVFLDLYDTSCNNAIIESIVRSCPMLINKHPAVEEYLGKKYPLYYNHLLDAGESINYDLIQTTAEYLQNLNHKTYTGEYFSDNLCNSLIDLGIGKKYKNQRTHLYNKPDSYRISYKTTDFNHRFGWSWVMNQIGNSVTNSNKKNIPTLYINDFIEHVFKIDNNNQTKNIYIDNTMSRAIRGYNLFAYKSSDLVVTNNTNYLWHNDKSQWIEYPESDLLSRDIEHMTISTYKNNDWVGFLHNPPKMPTWFDYGQNLDNIMKNNNDLIWSMRRCKKIFVLSEYLKTHVEKIFAKYRLNIPVVALKHPVPLSVADSQVFQYEKFTQNPRIVQLGYWMRKLHSIWQLDCDMSKIWLYGHTFAAQMLQMEHQFEKAYSDVLTTKELVKIQHSIKQGHAIKIKDVTITRVDNNEYDNILSSSVAYVDLYDSSANNSVIECIASTTPILVNKIPSVQEYLGKKYPLYFKDISEANRILKDKQRILDAHTYLKDNTDLIQQLNINKFLDQFKREIKKLCKR